MRNDIEEHDEVKAKLVVRPSKQRALHTYKMTQKSIVKRRIARRDALKVLRECGVLDENYNVMPAYKDIVVMEIDPKEYL